ncbi:MAG: hypothetical protein AB8B72_12160 [Crocinitomicaceae bacterium]
MIKQTLKDNLLSVSIAKKDFSYRIPVEKLGTTIDWKIGEKDSEGIIVKNVSVWTLQLFTKTVTEDQYIKQFKDIVKAHSPNNTINWKDTIIAVRIQNKYNWLKSSVSNDNKIRTEREIIMDLKGQYNIG